MRIFRHLALALAIGATVAFGAVVATPTEAGAQSQQRTNVGQLVSGLINVNVGAVAVNIGDVTVSDVVDVQDVLNNNQIDILTNVLNNSPIASNNSDILTNLLRNADLITDNQIVVGVLGGTFFVL